MSEPRRWIFNVGDLIEDDFSFVDSAEYDALKQERDELLDALHGLVESAILANLPFLSYSEAFDDAKDILIKYGKIKKEECARE